MTPVDLEQRERAIRQLATSLALSAGAGSGKTTVLASRIAEHLATGTAPSRLAAITFTEKAAGELESRVRDTLEKRLARAESDEARAKLEAALDRFHELTISTIHGFCRELLTYEPLEARWAPGTEIVPEDRSGLGAGLAAWRASLARSAPRTLELFDVLLKRAPLLDAIDDLLENRDLASEVAAEGLDWHRAHEELAAVLADIDAARARCKKPREDRLIENSAGFVLALRAWVALPGDGTFAALLSEDAGGRRGGKQGDWDTDGIQKYKEALDGIKRWRATQLTRAHRDLALSLEEHVLTAILSARREGAVASFDDLLFRAAELLRAPAVRARLGARWDALLVDEVQDTDPIQAEVAMLLARAAEHEGHWTGTPPRRGALFAVGDPKQSIYRFRRADVQVWKDLEDVIGKDGERGALIQNFRSVPGIVAWVNHTFADMPGYEPQVGSRTAIALDPVVVIDASVPGADEVTIEREVQALVRHIVDLRASGARVVDRESGRERPLAWRDVMVLLPRWTEGRRIAAELGRLGVEANVEGGGGFFDDPSVKAALAALRAIDEPADAESTVAALRALFGLTLEDLARHKAAEGSFRWTVRPQPAGPVADALTSLREAATLRTRSGVGRSWTSVLDALFDATRAPALWSILPDGPTRLANLDKLRALLRKIEREQRRAGDVLSQLTELERKNKEQDQSRLDVDTGEAGGDAVRITSIFKAKGLEAPVVVLMDAQRKDSNPSRVTERADPTTLAAAGSAHASKEAAGRLHVKIGGSFAPPDWEVTRDAEKLALREERARWMYVACTRARDQLLMIDHPRAALLHEYVERGLVRGVPHDETVEVAPDVNVRFRLSDALSDVEASDEVFPGRDAAVASLLASPEGKGDPEGERREQTLRAARGASARGCTRWKSVGEIVSARRRAGDDEVGTGVGATGGHVIHRAMERLDLTRPTSELLEAAPGLVRALADEAGLGAELAERCVAITAQLLAHPVLAEVRGAPEHWKETPFAFRDRARIVAGVIDLCFPEDASRKRWVVVDWKSDSPPEGHPHHAKYQAQLALYAQALIATVAPCESVRPVLVGPFPTLSADEAPAKEARDAALTAAADAVRPMLELLLEAGASLPAVGVDVGQPVITELELAWEDQKVGLALDCAPEDEAALCRDGWTLVSAARADAASIERAGAELAQLLGVRVAGDEGGTDAEPVDLAEPEA
jgi:ATP-dependent helicase/nuclease subunit A